MMMGIIRNQHIREIDSIDQLLGLCIQKNAFVQEGMQPDPAQCQRNARIREIEDNKTLLKVENVEKIERE